MTQTEVLWQRVGLSCFGDFISVLHISSDFEFRASDFKHYRNQLSLTDPNERCRPGLSRNETICVFAANSPQSSRLPKALDPGLTSIH